MSCFGRWNVALFKSGRIEVIAITARRLKCGTAEGAVAASDRISTPLLPFWGPDPILLPPREFDKILEWLLVDCRETRFARPD